MAKRRLTTEQRAARELRAVEREERKLDAIKARLAARAKSAAQKLETELKRKAEKRRKAEAKEHAELQRLFSGIKRHEVKRQRKPKARKDSILELPSGYYAERQGAGLVSVRTRRGTYLTALDGLSTAYPVAEAKRVAEKHKRSVGAAKAPAKRKTKTKVKAKKRPTKRKAKKKRA